MTFGIVYPKDIERLRIEKRAILIDIRPRDAYREGHCAFATKGSKLYVNGNYTELKILSPEKE